MSTPSFSYFEPSYSGKFKSQRSSRTLKLTWLVAEALAACCGSLCASAWVRTRRDSHNQNNSSQLISSNSNDIQNDTFVEDIPRKWNVRELGRKEVATSSFRWNEEKPLIPFQSIMIYYKLKTIENQKGVPEYSESLLDVQDKMDQLDAQYAFESALKLIEKESDYEKARQMFEFAAMLGHIPSSFNAAKLFDPRCQLSPSHHRSRAVVLYQLAAISNHARACFNLAMLLLEMVLNMTHETIYKSAIEWLKKADQLGNQKASKVLHELRIV